MGAAEADPYILGYGGQVGYGGYGGHVGYGGYGGYGLGYAGHYGLGYAGYGGYGHGYAAPAHHVYNHAGNSQVSPSASLTITGAAPAAVPGVVGARTYAGAGRYVANSAGTVHVAKREADPYVAGHGLGYAGYGGYGLGYAGHHGIGYAGYGGYAAAPVVHASPVHHVASVHATPVHHVAAGYSAPVHNVATVQAAPVHHASYSHESQVSPSASLHA